MNAAPRKQDETRRNNRQAALAMAGAAFGFACMSALAHGLRHDLPWPVVAFVRCLVMALVMVAVLWRSGAPLVVAGNSTLWLRSVFGTLGLLSTFYSISRLPVTDTVVIFAMSPLWIAVIMAVLERAKPPAASLAHITMALGGVWLMERPSFSAESLPLLLAVAGSVAVAVAMVSLSRTRDYPRETVVMHFSGFSTVVTLALSLPHAPLLAGVFGGNTHWFLLGAIGVTGTLGQLLMTAAYQKGRPTLVSVVGLSQIVFGAVFDVAIFGHRVDGWKVAGIALIVAGITLHLANHRGARA